jgi:hypothetical protein
MDRENHQLLNIIFFIGLVITIGTTVTLPMLTWSEDQTEKIIVTKEEVKKVETKTTKAKRLTFSY